MPAERCHCGNKATGACNDCERTTCDECASPDYRCYGCCGSNAEAASLFDDPELVSLDDDEDTSQGDGLDSDAFDQGDDFDAYGDF